MPERDCSGCTKQELWGCRALRWRAHPPHEPDHPSNWVRPAKLPVQILGETSYACPRQDIHENPGYWSWMLKFYGYYKKGFLPDSGGLLDQSNKAIEVFRVLDDANARCDEVELERRNRQNDPRNKRPARR